MKKILAAVAVSFGMISGVGVLSAADDPIAQRQDILENFGKVSKGPGAALKGEAKFDLASAQLALKTYAEGAKKLVGLFPENSQTGHDTEALPAIWKDKAKFDGLFNKLGADSEAAAKKITDEASFKAEFPKVLGDCKACHDDFRKKKS